MKVLVCGSRGWKNEHTVLIKMNALAGVDPGTTVIHGDARGADKMAAFYAEAYGLQVIPFPADWSKYGRKAGYLRNIQMLDEQPDLVIAFWDGISRGTKHTIDEATRRGIPVEVIKEEYPTK